MPHLMHCDERVFRRDAIVRSGWAAALTRKCDRTGGAAKPIDLLLVRSRVHAGGARTAPEVVFSQLPPAGPGSNVVRLPAD